MTDEEQAIQRAELLRTRNTLKAIIAAAEPQIRRLEELPADPLREALAQQIESLRDHRAEAEHEPRTRASILQQGEVHAFNMAIAIVRGDFEEKYGRSFDHPHFASSRRT